MVASTCLSRSSRSSGYGVPDSSGIQRRRDATQALFDALHGHNVLVKC
jgi:hypothetical protein